jgi:hypothetical protein
MLCALCGLKPNPSFKAEIFENQKFIGLQLKSYYFSEQNQI